MSSYWNYEDSDKIICPYCGEEYEPSYEDTYIGGKSVDCYTEDTEIYTCDNCGKEFTMYGYQEGWKYYTETIEGQATDEEMERRVSEMISIDEAIAHAREVAGERRVLATKLKAVDNINMCIKCAEEHEQLAEWLEELKDYREIGTVEGYKSAIKCYTEEYTIRKSNKQYNKAIDDYRTEICKAFVQSERNGNYRFYAVEIKQLIADLGEQLKGGGENV